MAFRLTFGERVGCLWPVLAALRPGAALNGLQSCLDLGLLRVSNSTINPLSCQQI